MTINNSIHQQERSVESRFNNNKLLAPPKSMTQIAIDYVNGGLSVIPIGKDKKPTVLHWTPFQKKAPHVSELGSWWQRGGLSIALVCGEGSGSLEVIDFDEKYNIEQISLFDRWKKLVEEEAPGLLEKLVTQTTISKGFHCLYRCETIEHNQKLAQRAATKEELLKKPDEKIKTLIETRGIGGYVLCYPSQGYGIFNREITDLPTITPSERETLISCARALNQIIDEKKVIRPKATKGNRPGDHYNREGDHRLLLEKHGWSLAMMMGEREQWRRPGKSSGVSATYFPESKVFYNFTSNASELEVNSSYSLFSLYTILEAGGDYSIAAKQLSEQGYGEVEFTNNTIGKAESFLNERYQFRRNVILQKTEYRKTGETEFKEMKDTDLNSLHLYLIRNKIEIGFDAFNRLLFSDFVEEHHPIKEYFQSLPSWDGTSDHIQELADSVTLKEKTQIDQWKKCLQRWLIGYVACALNDNVVNQTAIILVGHQGKGKTTWLNRLVPKELEKYRFVGTINPENKDSLVYLSECIMINLDELETMRKAEIGALKSIMTLPSVKVRRPYGRLSEDLVRRASFVGSINPTEFLNDPTGSRRFLTFEVESFDLEKYPDIDKVLSQAYELYQSGERWWFDEAEITKINEQNKQFAIASYEEELLLHHVRPETDPQKTIWRSATMIAQILRISNPDFQISDKTVRNIGIALTKHGYQSKKSNGTKLYATG